MPNPNPWRARQEKKRIRKPRNLAALQLKVWRALCEAEGVLEGAEDSELKLKAIHGISQCAGQYVRLWEAGELEARVLALEQRLAGRVA
jgi:hypothetical protein